MHSCTSQTQKKLFIYFQKYQTKVSSELVPCLKQRTHISLLESCLKPTIWEICGKCGRVRRVSNFYGKITQTWYFSFILRFYFSISFQFSLLHIIMISSPLLELLCEFSLARLNHWWKSFEKHRQRTFFLCFLGWKDFSNFDKIEWMDGAFFKLYWWPCGFKKFIGNVEILHTIFITEYYKSIRNNM